MNIKTMYGFAISWFIVASVCAAGCTLEDPCEPNETLSEDGRCIPIPTEPNDCGRSHYNCMSYGVEDAVCEVRTDAADNMTTHRCVVNTCVSNFHKSQNPDMSMSQVMSVICLPDTVNECGRPDEDCTKKEGVEIANCNSGQCKATACQQGYILSSGACLKNSTRECGAEDAPKTDCIESWLPNLYHNNATWIEASVPGCADNACIVSSCRNLTDESDQSEMRFVKKSCSDVIDFAEAYTAAYLDLHHTAIELPDCMDDNEKPKTIDACIEDLCPDDDAKFMPGVCGCGVFEDIADDDGDGVVNCLDACPNNPTKGKSSTNTVGNCDVLDTDGDGVDDDHDFCWTRDDIQIAKSEINAIVNKTKEEYELFLNDNGLCRSKDELFVEVVNGAERPICYKKDNSDKELYAAKMCGIYNDREEKYYIYHAADLIYLKSLLEKKYNTYACTNESDVCESKTKRIQCSNGIRNTYKCDNCQTKTDTNDRSYISCMNGNEPAAPDAIHPIRIFLEKDINLYDDHYEKMIISDSECYSMRAQIPYFAFAELDGKGHSIKFEMTSDDRPRTCSLMNSLFYEVFLASIKHITIELNGVGYISGLLAKVMDSVILDDVTITSSIDSYDAGSDGVGSLAGSAMNSYPELIKNQFTSIKLDRVTIHAPNANNVGGFLGNVSKLEALSLWSNNMNILGHNNVGGVFGNASGEDIQSCALEVHNDSIEGYERTGGVLGNGYMRCNYDVTNRKIRGNGDYTGGLVGYGNVMNDDTSFIRSVEIEGNGYVGGAIGYVDHFEGEKNTIVNVVQSIISHKHITGGFAGYVNECGSIHPCENTELGQNYKYWLYNKVDIIEAKGDSGGVFGELLIPDKCTGFISGIYNNVGVIEGSLPVGGVIANVKGSLIGINNVYNNVGKIDSNGEVGGIVGVVYQDDFKLELNIIYNSISKIGDCYSGGIVGYIDYEMSVVMDYIFNRVGLLTGGAVGGLIGALGEELELSMSNVHSQVDSLAKDNRDVLSGIIGHDIYSLSTSADISISNVSSWSNLLILDDNNEYAGVFTGNNNSSNESHTLTAVSIVNPKNEIICNNLYASDDACMSIDHDETNYFITQCDEPHFFGNSVCPAEDSVFTAISTNDSQLNSKIDDVVSSLSSDEHSWSKGRFNLGGQEIELPMVFTEEEFLKKLPTPDQRILDEMDAWLKSVADSDTVDN